MALGTRVSITPAEPYDSCGAVEPEPEPGVTSTAKNAIYECAPLGSLSSTKSCVAARLAPFGAGVYRISLAPVRWGAPPRFVTRVLRAARVLSFSAPRTRPS